MLIELKGKIDINIIIVKEFNKFLTMDRSSSQRVNKETVDLNNTIN